jgi:hypothetical protein
VVSVAQTWPSKGTAEVLSGGQAAWPASRSNLDKFTATIMLSLVLPATLIIEANSILFATCLYCSLTQALYCCVQPYLRCK